MAKKMNKKRYFDFLNRLHAFHSWIFKTETNMQDYIYEVWITPTAQLLSIANLYEDCYLEDKYETKFPVTLSTK